MNGIFRTIKAELGKEEVAKGKTSGYYSKFRINGEIVFNVAQIDLAKRFILYIHQPKNKIIKHFLLKQYLEISRAIIASKSSNKLLTIYKDYLTYEGQTIWIADEIIENIYKANSITEIVHALKKNGFYIKEEYLLNEEKWLLDFGLLIHLYANDLQPLLNLLLHYNKLEQMLKQNYNFEDHVSILEEKYKKIFSLPDNSDLIFAIKLLFAIECDAMNYRFNKEGLNIIIPWWKYWL